MPLVLFVRAKQHLKKREDSYAEASQQQSDSCCHDCLSGCESRIEKHAACQHQQTGAHEVAGHDLLAVHPVREGSEQKPENKKRKKAVDHQECMRPPRRNAPCPPTRSSTPRGEIKYPPGECQYALQSSSQEHGTVRRRGKIAP